jgi:peptidoglycan/LPS O-acetylase OafA/YrhL
MTLLDFIQYFLVGFLLADIHSTRAAAGRFSARSYDLFGAGCLVALALAPDTHVMKPFLPWLLGGIFIGALRGKWFTAVLRRPSISVLGGMCYSLYLLHLPLLSFIATKVVRDGMTVPQAYLRLAIWGMPVAVGAGIAYYILIERPCMNPNWPRVAYQNVSRFVGVLFGTVRPAPKSSGIND